MTEAAEGVAFKYGGKSYRIMTTESGTVQVYRSLKRGLKPVHGQLAFRVIQAYRLKAEGVVPVRKPRTFAKRPKRRFR